MRVGAARRPSLPQAVLACVLGGLVLFLVFPPVGWWPLAFVAPAIFLWATRTAGPARGFVLGLVFGLVGYGAILYWIFRFGALAWVALSLLSALSIGLFGALAPLIRRPEAPVRSAVGLAALWTVFDHLRGVLPFGGFTWGSVGASQVDDRILVRLATVTGVAGVTFVVVLAAALAVLALTGGGGVRRRAGRLAAALTLVLAPGLIPFSVPNGETLDVATLQVDVRVPPGTSTAAQDRIVAERHIALSDRLAQEPGPRPDLVLWGEGALDPAATADPSVMAAVRDAIARTGAPTVIGAVLNDPDGSQHTSVLAFDGNGAPAGRYDKVHLVPYGEYVPFRSRLGFIDALRQIPVDRVPGERIHTIAPGGLPPFGTPICFENSFPEIPRAFVEDGATFLVVPVNNASYGFTAASDQHLQMSRIRAVETGRWIVDAAISGVSAFVAPDGTVTARTPLFESDILRSRIVTSTARTPYARLGDWFVWLSLFTSMGIALTPRRRTAARPAPGPLTADPRTLVILPTYDEAITIEGVVRRVLAHPEAVDVLVVDDSSPDGTAAIVERMATDEPRLRIHVRPEKRGLKSAYVEGFRLALAEDYDLVVEMDSDLSHDPDELSSLLSAAQTHDLVIGSRYIPGGSVTNWSRSRVALSRGGNRYTRFMLGVPIHDATSGYRVYRRALVQDLVSEPITSDGYGFQIELVLRAHLGGYDIGEVPITFRERAHGVSKISRRIVVEALWHVTRWGVRLRLGRRRVI